MESDGLSILTNIYDCACQAVESQRQGRWMEALAKTERLVEVVRLAIEDSKNKEKQVEDI